MTWPLTVLGAVSVAAEVACGGGRSISGRLPRAHPKSSAAPEATLRAQPSVRPYSLNMDNTSGIGPGIWGAPAQAAKELRDCYVPPVFCCISRQHTTPQSIHKIQAPHFAQVLHNVKVTLLGRYLQTRQAVWRY